jgi:transcriptional regulator with XRE-family HTH domain
VGVKLKQKPIVTKDAKQLRSMRVRLGMTQRDLAREFYVTPGAVAQWELGINPIPGPVKKLIELYERKLK